MKIGIKTIAKGGRDENSTLNTTRDKREFMENYSDIKGRVEEEFD